MSIREYVWVLISSSDAGEDVWIFATRKDAVAWFRDLLVHWPSGDWRPGPDAPTSDRLAAINFFEQKGYYTYDDEMSYGLHKEEVRRHT